MAEGDSTDQHLQGEQREDREQPVGGRQSAGAEFSADDFQAVEIGQKQKPQGPFALFGTKAIGSLRSAENEAKEKSERGIGLEDLARTKSKHPHQPGEQNQESRRGNPA